MKITQNLAVKPTQSTISNLDLPHFLLLATGFLFFGNSSGSFSFAILCTAASAFEIFIFARSVSLGGATLQPISWKYLDVLLGGDGLLILVRGEGGGGRGVVGKDRRGDGRKRCLLFGFEPEVVAEVADVGNKVVDCEGESADVGCEVVEVPFIQFTRQPVVSLQVSSKKRPDEIYIRSLSEFLLNPVKQFRADSFNCRLQLFFCRHSLPAFRARFQASRPFQQ